MLNLSLPPLTNKLRSLVLEGLGSEIGIYTLPNGGGQIPAIGVVAGEKFPPSGTEVKGLEVLIQPAISQQRQAFHRAIAWIYTSEFLLRQWDFSSDLVLATHHLFQVLNPLGRVTILPRILPVSEIGNIETRTIQLVHSEYISYTSKEI